MAIALFALTAVSGLVDAATYLKFGHVFVANMTGNVVFVGFALAGAGGLSLASSAVAVGAFFVGALVAGRLARTIALDRPGLLRAMTGLELVLVVIAIAIGFLWPVGSSVPAFGVVALLAAAMGIQSTTTSRLNIPGINSTVVLTTMIATMAAASRLAGGSGANDGRRILAISSMFVGGLIGAGLTLRINRLAPLWLAALVLVIACVGAHVIKNRSR